MYNSGNQALRDLGIFYCSAYVVSLTACSLAWWLYWDAWRLDSLLPDLAVITHGVGGRSVAGDNSQGGSVEHGIGRDEDKAMEGGRA